MCSGFVENCSIHLILHTVNAKTLRSVILNFYLIFLSFCCQDVESYIHRSGRTGRAGRTGVCICFYQRKEEDQLRYVENKAVGVFWLIDIKQRQKKIFKSWFIYKKNNGFCHIFAWRVMEMDLRPKRQLKVKLLQMLNPKISSVLKIVHLEVWTQKKLWT